jgi:hypothetical protein
MAEDDGTFYVCETCRERIDPDAPDTVRAVEMKKIETMGPTVEWVEGLGAFFHEHHFPEGSPHYRRKTD